MRKLLFLGSLVWIMAFGIVGSAYAQTTDSITVSAVNNGIFQFTIAGASFDFGSVGSDGTTSSTGVPGVRNGSNTGSTYTATTASTWTVRSAPPRTVRLFNASTTSTIAWGTADRLSLSVPATGLPAGSTSCGAKTFSTVGDGGNGSCGAGNLIHTISAGNGANARTGNLDLLLDVLDADATGSNSWTVVVTAAGV